MSIEKIQEAIENGNAADVEACIRDGVSVSHQDENKTSLLHLAAKHGHPAIVQLLLAKGADPNIQNESKWTPLHCASQVDVVKILVEQGANIHAANLNGETAVLRACGKGYLDIVKYLVDKGASVASTSTFSPLHHACFSGDLNLVMYLVEKCGCSVNSLDQNGSSPMHMAILAENLQIVKFLYLHHAHLDCVDKMERNPLRMAEVNDQKDIVCFLRNPGSRSQNFGEQAPTIAKQLSLDLTDSLFESSSAPDVEIMDRTEYYTESSISTPSTPALAPTLAFPPTLLAPPPILNLEGPPASQRPNTEEHKNKKANSEPTTSYSKSKFKSKPKSTPEKKNTVLQRLKKICVCR